MLYVETLLSTVILSGDTTIIADSRFWTSPAVFLSMERILIEKSFSNRSVLGLKSGKVSNTVSENSLTWFPDMPAHANNVFERVLKSVGYFAQQMSLIVLMIISCSESSRCSRKLIALVITSFLIVLNGRPL